VSTPIKCTAFFGSDEGWGWSESHHINANDPVGSLLPFLQAFDGLMVTFRRPLLGKDRYMVGARVAYRGSDGSIRSSALKYQPAKYPGNQREGCAPHLAAKVRFGELANAQFSDVYLRGFWDAVEQNEELDFTTAAGAAWKALLDQYTTALVVGNYGWMGTKETTTRRGNVTGYTVDVDGFVTFTITIASGPALPATGTLLSFRAARLNNSNSALNRTHIVTVASPTTVKTKLRTAALPFVSAGTYVITAVDFLKYTGVQYTVLARRKAGAPFFHTPGRLKARPRG